jgi:HK97 family phage prohead protease
MDMITRAWSTLDVKALDEEQRLIEGIATTPVTDRTEDIVEPKGAQFNLPLKLLYQHNPREPIGHVIAAKVSDEGIAITARIEKGMPHIEHAWELIKRRLVGGLSIGFRSLEHEDIKGSKWGRRFKKWEWIELSAVTVGANQDASITSIKALDLEQRRAASGKTSLPVVRLNSHQPGVAGAKPYVIREIYVNDKHRADRGV